MLEASRCGMHHDFSVINSFKKQRTYCIDLIKPPSYMDMVLLYLINNYYEQAFLCKALKT